MIIFIDDFLSIKSCENSSLIEQFNKQIKILLVHFRVQNCLNKLGQVLTKVILLLNVD